MATTPTPSVGRSVWFYEGNHQKRPMHAVIVRVWVEGELDGVGVNLTVCDPDNAIWHPELSVELGHERTKTRHYRWPTII